MVTVFDEIKGNEEGIIDFALACCVAFGREVLEGAFKKVNDEDFKKVIMETYDKTMHSDLSKYKVRKQIRKMLQKEIEEGSRE